MRLRTVLPTLGLGLVLAACGTSYGGSGSGSGGQPAAGANASSTSGAVTALKIQSSSLGMIVTDENGRTLYEFDKDTQGATSSACTAGCMGLWPAAHEGSAMPTLTGVTAKVATITGADGAQQLTLNGWPLYYYSGDSGPGAVAGQNVQGIWHVLTASGAPVTTAAGSGSGSTSGGGGGGYGSGY